MLTAFLTGILAVAPFAAALGTVSDGPAVNAWAQTASLIEPDPGGAGDDELGAAVALAGATAFVGAPGQRTVYVYDGSTAAWTQATRLDGPARFGRALATDGETLAVGADGRAFAFTRSGGAWAPSGELEVADMEGSLYGWSVDVAGDTIAVGAPGQSSGEVHLFRQVSGSWQLSASLSCTACGSLGEAVALDDDGDTLAIGAPHGNAYVYTREGGTWTQAAHLTGPAGFGGAVALGGDVLTVGAGLRDTADIYTRDGDGEWELAAELRPPSDLIEGASFGSSVAVASKSGHVVIGARFDDPGPAGIPASPVPPPQVEGIGVPNSGAVHVYAPVDGGWSHAAKLSPPGVFWGEKFGASVAVSADGGTIMAGAPDHKRGPAWTLDMVGVPHDTDDMAFVFESLLPTGAGVSGGWA